ncbi:RING-H2 finger protein ATL57 [Populus alba]|uniref:RING-type E3 ubiquitin transferase n=3 Tax=Populus TaxID=3689 RepID=A0A4V6A1N7_POPAL|nr:RING-H2 finger protein ATL57-like [Populus alba]KAJ7012226.1 RING-H2 finger protein ATL57-like [Populus alba x Populus x berolinensis]TKR75135.1 RING-H2 finger protein ATL57 [Populus alba]
MKLHNRKLQVPFNDAPFEHPITPTFQTSNSTMSPPPFKEPTTIPPPTTTLQLQQQQQFYSRPGFDPSVALTILFLLIALFFMGFFSIYTRKFSVNPSSSSSSEGFYNSHRQRGTGTPGPASTSSRPSRASTSSRITRGLDPQVVNSLPVYSYYHGNVKYQVECAICLGEFEEKEAVKMIPECHHVFHLQCIDTWLAMHVTCPVCRGAHFVHEKGGGNDGLGVIQERVDQGASQPDGDTSLEVRGELIGVQA